LNYYFINLKEKKKFLDNMASNITKLDNPEEEINFMSIFESSKDNSEKLQSLFAKSLKFTKFNETEVSHYNF
jgi:hypothetical protein